MQNNTPDNGRKTSLVLGSGGAKGMVHIGVIRCLEDRGFNIRYVAGSSIGALVGGIYAAGKLDVYADWVCALEKADIVRLLDWAFSGAIFKGDRIINVLQELIGEHKIETLPIGFTAVATDLSVGGKGGEVWFNQGPLLEAIRASMAVPTIFAPVEMNGRLLVDGGVINPVPVAPTLNNHTDLTIAVDLNGVYGQKDKLSPAEKTHEPGPIQQAYHRSIGQYLDRLWPVNSKPEDERLGFADIAIRSMEAMQATITQFKLAATTPNLTISIPRNLCNFFDFYRAEDLIEYGYKRTEEALDRTDLGMSPIEKD